jgi:preprotein translocase SecE subunit
MEIDGSAYDVVVDEILPNPSIGRWEFDFPQVSSEPLPEIKKLLDEVQANQDRVEKLLDTYSFVQKYIFRELGKVQWPDRDTLVQASAVTLLFVAVAAAYLGALDALFSKLVDLVI